MPIKLYQTSAFFSSLKGKVDLYLAKLISGHVFVLSNLTVSQTIHVLSCLISPVVSANNIQVPG